MEEIGKIYIANLGAYVAGKLAGRWVEPYAIEAIEDAIKELKAEDPNAEEFIVHDYDGFPNMGETSDWTAIVAVAEGLEEHGDMYRAWMSLVGTDCEGSQECADTFQGTYEDVEDIGRQSAEGEVPEWLRFYVDWEALGEARLQDASHCEYEGRIYVWRG